MQQCLVFNEIYSLIIAMMQHFSIMKKNVCYNYHFSTFCPGLSIHISAGEYIQRPYKADNPKHQERPELPAPGAREPGAAMRGQHRQPRDGGGFRPGPSQAVGVRVSSNKFIKHH